MFNVPRAVWFPRAQACRWNPRRSGLLIFWPQQEKSMSADAPLSIAVIVGSLRRESFNRHLAEALVKLPEAAGHAFAFSRIDDLPLYNQDDDGDQPAPARRLKAEIRAADAVIFATPEYNRSIPGVLKNAIDHASRPHGDSAWAGKPAGILGMSPGQMGTALAQQHLRNVLSALDVKVLGLPELYLQHREGVLNEDGSLGERTAGAAGKWLAKFLAHASLHRAAATA
jgi:chromate reductase